MTLTEGLYLGNSDSVANELVARLDEITDRSGSIVPPGAFTQGEVEVRKAREAKAAGHREHI